MLLKATVQAMGRLCGHRELAERPRDPRFDARGDGRHPAELAHLWRLSSACSDEREPSDGIANLCASLTSQRQPSARRAFSRLCLSRVARGGSIDRPL